MEDVLTGSFFLLLVSVAVLLGLWLGGRRSAWKVFAAAPTVSARLEPAQVDGSSIRNQHPVGRWLARVMRVPSPDEAGTICATRPDPDVDRLLVALSR